MITCKLKCKCTDGEVSFEVRERMEGEDIIHYMEALQIVVGQWHEKRGCPETALEYLKMPTEDGKPIGVVG